MRPGLAAVPGGRHRRIDWRRPLRQEAAALPRHLMIGASRFFRDPDALDALGLALRRSTAERPADQPMRAWVAGCATGEEAYSVAILLREALGTAATPLQIFASDIEAAAVSHARGGFYPASITADVAPTRLQAHFVAGDGGFRIAKAIRDSVVFSVHDALNDPPFTRMDLICCRDLPMPLDPSAQARLLSNFHFAGKPHGLLLLGSTETADAADGCFAVEDERHRLYRARAVARRVHVEPAGAAHGELQSRIDETRKADDDLHNLMVSAEIGAVFVDRAMRVTRYTPQAATLFNLRQGDVGRSLLDITHRLDYPELEADAADVMRELRRVEREVRAADGRWFVARALPYRTSEDRIDGMIFAFIDVSARKAAEEQLRLSEQRMRLVAMSMRDYAILTIDAAGVLSSWSPGAERVFGYTPEEAIGEPFALIFTEEDRAAGAPAEELRKARENGRAPDDRWHRRKGGQLIYCSGITTPLIEGSLVGYAKIARDYTMAELRDRQRDAALREVRIERGKLQEASLLKDEFLAVMSHELKNPLAVIQMSATLLTRLPAFAAEPRAGRATEAILSAVVSQAQIINDLLELSRVNMGKVVLRLAPVDLGELVRGIGEAVMPDVEAKQQRLELDLAASVTVVADSVRAEQIVWNLLTNAVKFTPEGGWIRVALTVGGEMAELSVADSGIGMDPSALEDVFEMFRQVETGPSRSKTGLGIGLALVKQLTLLHGGRVEARSEGAGRGAEFRIWLPLAAPVAVRAEAPPPAAEPARLRGLKVLLVDDEPVLLAAFADLLQAEGASVVPAGTAEQAVELARGGTFDLVISDIAMPEHDGYWLARQLRAGPNGPALTIVAVSGMARDADRQKAIAAGFDAHVGKPLDFDLLQAEIESAVTRRRDLAG